VRARKPGEALAFAESIAEAAPQCQAGAPRWDRFGELIGEQCLMGIGIKESRVLAWRERVRAAQRASVLGGCFAMRSKPDRALGGGRSEIERCRAIACTFGVVRQAGDVFLTVAVRAQCGEDPRLQRDAP
jgi:hypothetical protein